MKRSGVVTLRGTLLGELATHFAASQDVVVHSKKLQVFATAQPKWQSPSGGPGVVPSSRRRPPQSPSRVQVRFESFEQTPPHCLSAMQVIPGVGLPASHMPHWMSSSQRTEESLLQVPTPLFAH